MTKKELEEKLEALEKMQNENNKKINENVETLRSIVDRFHYKEIGKSGVYVKSLLFDCDEFLFGKSVLTHTAITGKVGGDYLFAESNKKRIDDSIVKVVNYLESKGQFDNFLEFMLNKIIPAFIAGNDLPWFDF